MCAIFGFLDYGHIVSNRMLKKLLHELSIAAECRGKDATGMSYVKHGKIVTFKKAKPAHKVKMYFPNGAISSFLLLTMAVSLDLETIYLSGPTYSM